MTDEKPPSTITLNLGDPKTWLAIVSLVGGPALVNKLSLSNVENQQQKVSETAVKAVEAQVSIDDKLEKVTRFQGELSFRMEQQEKRMRELQDSIDTKTTTKAGK